MKAKLFLGATIFFLMTPVCLYAVPDDFFVRVETVDQVDQPIVSKQIFTQRGGDEKINDCLSDIFSIDKDQVQLSLRGESGELFFRVDNFYWSFFSVCDYVQERYPSLRNEKDCFTSLIQGNAEILSDFEWQFPEENLLAPTVLIYRFINN